MTTASSRPAPFYGWTITYTLAITQTILWGILYYTFTVFLTPMERELGWSRAEITAGFSLALLVRAAAAYPVGAWIDHRGPRLLMALGSVGGGACMVAWAAVTDKVTFYLVWAAMGVSWAALLYEPAFAVVTKWFVAKRGRALAIITFAAGLASTIFIPFADILLQAVGWRHAVLILAAVVVLTTALPHLLILRRRPDDMGLLPDGAAPVEPGASYMPTGTTVMQAVRSRYFWILVFAFGFSSLAAESIRVHFIPFLIAGGVMPSAAAAASGAIGVMQVVGRLAFAPLDARFSSRTMVIGVFAVQTLSLIVLFLGTAGWVIVLFVAIYGASYGAKTLARVSILADSFGASHYGRISSLHSIFLTLATTVAPVGAALIFDQTGSYNLVVVLIVCFSVMATFVAAFAYPPSSY